jgi:adenylate kinase family enzyme
MIEIPKRLDRVAIIGYAGSGKSTLARKIGAKIDAEVLHIDKIQWLPNWQEQTSEKKLEIMSDFLDKNSRWVIDGNYHKLFAERRMAEADLIIFLNLNRFTCLWRAFKRKREYKGRSRESMTEGCEERINGEFFWWLVYKGRTKKRQKKLKNLLGKHYKHISMPQKKEMQCS